MPNSLKRQVTAEAPTAIAQDHKLDTAVCEVQTALARARAELVDTQNLEQRARHQALSAGLTSLRSGLHFHERLQRMLALIDSSRHALAVLHLDLNVMAPISDVHGLEVADSVIDIVASRLERQMRPDDMVSRLGGDEFACMLADGVEPEALSQFAGQLFDAVALPVQVGALELSVQPNIGISIYPDDGDTAQSLLKSADAAMYQAKRNNSRFAFANRPAER